MSRARRLKPRYRPALCFLGLLFGLTSCLLKVSCAPTEPQDITNSCNAAARAQRIRDTARASSRTIRGKEVSPPSTELQSFGSYNERQSDRDEEELAERTAELQALDVRCHDICQRVLRRMFPSKVSRRQDIYRIQHCPMTIAGPCGMDMKDVRTSAMSTPSYASYGFGASSPFSLSAATLSTADLSAEKHPKSITQHLAQRNVWDHVVPKALHNRASEVHKEQPSDIFFFGPYYSHTGKVKTIGRLPVGLDQRKLQRQTAMRRMPSQRLPADFFESPYDRVSPHAQVTNGKTDHRQELPRLSYSKAV